MPAMSRMRAVGVVAVAEHHPALALELVEHLLDWRRSGPRRTSAAPADRRRVRSATSTPSHSTPPPARDRGRRSAGPRCGSTRPAAGRPRTAPENRCKSPTPACPARQPATTSPITGANLAIAPAPQIVAVGEAAGHHHRVDALEVGVGVPQADRLGAGQPDRPAASTSSSVPGNVMTPTRAVMTGSLLTDQSSITVFASSDSAISARVSSSMLSSTSSSKRLPCRTSETPPKPRRPSAPTIACPCGSRISAFGITCTTTLATAITLPAAFGRTASPARPEVRGAQRRRHRVEDLRVGHRRASPPAAAATTTWPARRRCCCAGRPAGTRA